MLEKYLINFTTTKPLESYKLTLKILVILAFATTTKAQTHISGNPELCDSGFRIDPVVSGTYFAPDGFSVTITATEKSFSWTSEYPISSLVVKGGTGAYMYEYGENGSCGENGLVAPENKGLSHLDFCYNSPVISCPADATVSNSESTKPIDTGMPTITPTPCSSDDLQVNWSDEITRGSCDNEWITSRTFTITYAGFPSLKCNQIIKIEDNTPPEITGIGENTDISSSKKPVFSNPIATDESGDVSMTYSDIEIKGECANEYSITRTWIATDACGNASSASQTITVLDNTPPVISGIDLDTMKVISCSDTQTFSIPKATDDGEEVTLTFEDVRTKGDATNEYRITRTWNATDACGNTTTASQTIVYDNDLTPPTINGVGVNAVISCSDTPEFSKPIANDACSSVSLTFEDVRTEGDCTNEYSITRLWTATDDFGNVTTASQTITVLDRPPLIKGIGANAVISCSETPEFSKPTVIDECGDATLTFEDVRTEGDCANEYSITRTWTAEDDCGNTTTACQTITVLDRPPVINAVGVNKFISCSETPEFSKPTVIDECGDATMTFEDVRTEGNCTNEYSITRTWTAEDDCGNTSTANQTITVIDRPPVINGVGVNKSISCSETPEFSKPTVIDECGDATMTFEDVRTEGDCANEYSITRTWTAMDDCGNTTTASQTITVIDNTALAFISVPQDIEACKDDTVWIQLPKATSKCNREITISWSSDNNLTLTETEGYLSGKFSGETTNITFIATDVYGNESYTDVLVKMFNCNTGCTLTQGYWKNHLNNEAWSRIGEEKENADFFLSGKTYYEVMWSSVEDNQYYNFAHQYIAAILNQNNGAPSTPEVDDAILTAEDLFSKYVPLEIEGLPGESPLRNTFVENALILDQYNNGVIGPGHCNDKETEEPIQVTSYPNPLTDASTILFSVPYDSQKASLDIYDMDGKLIDNLFKGEVNANQVYETRFDATSISNQMLLYKISTQKGAKYGKLIIKK